MILGTLLFKNLFLLSLFLPPFFRTSFFSSVCPSVSLSPFSLFPSWFYPSLCLSFLPHISPCLSISFIQLIFYAWVVEQFPAVNNIMHIYFYNIGGLSSGYILRSGNAGSRADVLLCRQCRGPLPGGVPPASSTTECIVKLLNCCQCDR